MSASTVNCVSRMSRRENSSRRMRLSRVFGKKSFEFPVICLVTPELTASPAILADPRRRRAVPRQRGLDALRLRSNVSANTHLTMRDQKHARFQALCQTLRPDLLRFAIWLARDRAIAEDVVQETLLRAWKSQDSLHDEKSAKPWFLTIVRREYARTFERKRLPTVDLDDLVAGEEPSLASGADQDLAELRLAIFKLPDEYREPLVLQVLLGYSTAEIAAELELSNAAVLTRLFRARRQLRVLCGENGDEDPQE
jgi:RNA polymerase sigma-70 factor (ECF subfamily)